MTVPAAGHADLHHPIDRFLAAGQRQVGVTANLLVDRRRLLQRLSDTLIGLPPALQDIDAFVADSSPNAIDRCVDRLLASPHYGVRWGRHWLDVARFAESHGYEHDYDRPTAYHYRDFVIQSFNSDQPFDEFARWQIAGDRLAPDNRFAWMATGFLAAGPHSTQITRREVERQRYDELDDMVSTIGLAFLGLNVDCARCHDHPYDPIPQGDFYRLAAFFTKTVRSDVPLDFDPEGYRRAHASFLKEHARLNSDVVKYESHGLRSAYREWLQRATPEEWRTTWHLPEDVTVTSQGEPKWTANGDGSWTIESPSRDKDRYEITLRSCERVTAVRVEMLTDSKMTHGGPGRAPDGTFLLSGVTLLRDRREAALVQVPLAKAHATFEQVDAGVAGVLDDNAETAWGIDPQLGRNHAIVLHLAEPVKLQPGEQLRVLLDFATRPHATAGRLRVAITSAPDPAIEIDTAPISEAVARALEKEPSTLNDTEWLALARWFGPRDAEWRRLDALRQEHATTAPQPRMSSVLVATEGHPAIRLHTQAKEEFLPETNYLQRGDSARPVGVAVPAVLQLFPTDDESRQDRAGLARWLTDVDHGAGALLARVVVNRLWQHHFGTGLVATPDDFGSRGERPSHPELLDWLAAELIRQEWRLKPIQRMLVTSAAFQRSSFPTAEGQQRDPENRTLWRWSPRRRDAEVLRDAQLFVSGELDDRLDGPSEREPDHRRRSVFTCVKRSAPEAWLAGFDGPDGCRVVGSRARTTSSRQALALLNGTTTRTAAERLAALYKAEPDAINTLFQHVLQRSPTPIERSRVMRFLEDHRGPDGWVDLCQTMMCLDEFVFLD
ncbi:MAG TPA: DUF1549 and DUF1553 domain-containing protein [Planctomycetaceae bacterium]|nr:DUF1549 and DUF1553 domain-containing protein [Planctomycetaceae bacterium]